MSAERILTTHTGSLPRPAGLTDRHDPEAVRAAVAETVRRQVAAGIDVIGDGEMSKPGYSTYVTERLSGFGGPPVRVPRWGYEQFPEFARKMWGTGKGVTDVNPSCDGPVSYRRRGPVAADIAYLRAAAAAAPPVAGLFLTAASPGVIDMFMKSTYYPSTEAYVFALADAMKTEYDAIYQAGLTLQLDCPDLACAWTHGSPRTVAEFRREVGMRLAALDHATRDIPAEAMRLHLCWGNFAGPHTNDIPLADIIDLVLQARPRVVSFEGANPRHEHEWQVFEDVRLPDGKAIMPGVIDSTTNYVEHPELVAQRIGRYAGLVGRQNVIAGTDCGFATFVTHVVVEPEITWAKLATLAEGARRASERGLKRLPAGLLPAVLSDTGAGRSWSLGGASALGGIVKFLSVMPNLYVADVEASAAFYRDLLGGTETFRAPASGASTHVEIRVGDVLIAVSSRGEVAPQGLPSPSGGHPFELVVWCDSADEAVAGLRAAGVPVVVEPAVHVSGHRRGYVADPDGNWVAVVSEGTGGLRARRQCHPLGRVLAGCRRLLEQITDEPRPPHRRDAGQDLPVPLRWLISVFTGQDVS